MKSSLTIQFNSLDSNGSLCGAFFGGEDEVRLEEEAAAEEQRGTQEEEEEESGGEETRKELDHRSRAGPPSYVIRHTTYAIRHPWGTLVRLIRLPR